jgi:hypothetical protein
MMTMMAGRTFAADGKQRRVSVGFPRLFLNITCLESSDCVWDNSLSSAALLSITIICDAERGFLALPAHRLPNSLCHANPFATMIPLLLLIGAGAALELRRLIHKPSDDVNELQRSEKRLRQLLEVLLINHRFYRTAVVITDIRQYENEVCACCL